MIACSLFDIGNSREREVIRKAVREQCIYIFDATLSSRIFFDDSIDKKDVTYFFPPRYLRERTDDEILKIVFEIKDIMYSDIIRWELKPIYTYVIYQMIDFCYGLEYENFSPRVAAKHLMPDLIAELLKNTSMGRDDKYNIRHWFTDAYWILEDYCDYYDSDLTDLHMMECLAYHYIYQPAVYQMMGADIEDALDMIPKDLADLFREVKRERTKGNQQKYDFFISYASENKKQALSLVESLKEKNASVWFDDKELKIGDQIRTMLEQGLINSKYGIVLISNEYLNKYWTNQELNSLYEMEEHGIKKILPILLNISHEEVKQKSPFLASKYSLIYDENNLDEITSKIISDCLV